MAESIFQPVNIDVNGLEDLNQLQQKLEQVIRLQEQLNKASDDFNQAKAAGDSKAQRNASRRQSNAQKNLKKEAEAAVGNLDNLIGSVKRFDQVLEKVTNGAIKNINQLSRQVERGSPQSQLFRSETRRQLNELDVSPLRRFTQVTNKSTNNVRDLAKAFDNLNFQTLIKQRQAARADDSLRDIDQRIQAQRTRASIVPDRQGRPLSGSARQGAQRAEQRALDQLLEERARRIEQDRQQRRDQQQRQRFQDRLQSRLTDSRVQREVAALSGRQAATDPNRVRRALRAVESRLESERQRTGGVQTERIRELENTMARLADREQTLIEQRRNEASQRRQAQQQERQRQRRQDRITDTIRQAQALRNRPGERAGALQRAQQFRLERAREQSGGERTEAVRREEQRLERIKNLQDTIKQNGRERNQQLRQRNRLFEQLSRSRVSRNLGPDSQDRVRSAQQATRTRLSNELSRTGGERTQRVAQLEQQLSNLIEKERRLKELSKGQTNEENQTSKALREQERLQEQITDAENKATLEAQDGNRLEELQNQEKAKQKQLTLELLQNENKINGTIRKRQRELEQIRRQREDAQTQRGRRNTENRLFGDGGAGLFRIQSALAANFLVLDQIFNLFQFGAQFVAQLDQELKNLQAITDTTTTQMKSLEERLINVSEASKFTAVEVAQAATTLGQAGFSAEQIQESIQGVTRLATATGTTLRESVDAATNAMKIFKIQASRTSDVADIFTSAVNNSKLTVDKLTQSMQFAGNAAAQSGQDLRELVAATGALANAGIRSGSKLGTSIRRLIAEFQKPQQQFIRAIKNFGLSLEDINVRTNGLLGVMENLRDAGFTTSEAFRTMEIRAGEAFAALSNNLESARQLETATLLSNAAMEAQQRQMEGLINKGARLKSAFGTFLKQAGEPVLRILKSITDAMTNLFKALNDVNPAITTFVGTVATFAAAGFGIAKIGALVGGLTNIRQILPKVAASFATATTAASAFRVATTGILSAINPIIAVATLAGTVLGGIFASNADQAAAKIDQLQAKVDKARGRFEQQSNTVTSLNKSIDRLINRQRQLQDDQSELTSEAIRLREKFADIGGQFDSTGGKVGNFIEQLRTLRKEMKKAQEQSLEVSINRRNATINSEFGSGVADTRDKVRDSFARFNAFVRSRIQRERGRISNSGQGVSAGTRELQKLQERITGAVSLAAEEGATKVLSRMESLRDQIRQLGASGKFQEAFEKSQEGVNIIQSNLSKVAQVIRDINRGEVLENASEDVRNSALSMLRNTLQLLQSVKARFQNTGARLQRQQRDEVSQAAARFSQDPRVQAITRFVEERRRRLSELRNLSPSNLSEQELRARNQEIRRIQEQLSEGRRQVRDLASRILADSARLTVDQVLQAAGESTATGRIKKISGEAAQIQQGFVKQLNELVKSTTQRQQDILSTQIDSVKEGINEFSTRQEIAEARQSVTAKARERMRASIKNSLANITKGIGTEFSAEELSDKALSGNLDEVLSGTKLRKAKKRVSEALAKFQNSIAGLFSDQTQAISEARNSLRETIAQARSNDQRGTSAREIQQNLQQQVNNAQQPVNRLDTILSSGQSDLTTTEKTTLERRKRQAQTQALRDEVEARRAAAEQFNQLTSRLRSRRNRAESEFQQQRLLNRRLLGKSAVSQLLGGSSSPDFSEGVLKQAERRTSTLDEQRVNLRKSFNRALEKQEENQRALVDVTTKLDARMGRLDRTNRSVAQSLNAAFQNFIQNEGRIRSMSEIIGNGLPNVLGQAQSSFSTFVTDVTSGTKSIAGAFKGMAQSIVQSMQKIIAQALARRAISGIFGSILGGGGGLLAGTPQFTGGAGFAAQGSAIALNEGGFVSQAKKRAAQGTFNPNRDSVPALLRPGEFVFRKSAVDALGRDNLAQLNAQQNRQVSRSDAAFQPVAPSREKEESEPINIWVVQEQDRPVPSEKDIVATVSKDLARGGQTKQLVKKVQRGRL